MSNDVELERPDSVGSSLSEYNFDRLFDPDQLDHLPIEEQLKRYKSRDLRKVKVYKCAAKIWGPPLSRTRRIVATMNCHQQSSTPAGQQSCVSGQQLLLPDKESSDLVEMTDVDMSKFVSAGNLNNTSEEASAIAKTTTTDALMEYRKWLDERKRLRNNLDSLGLTEEWLANKPDKSPLEQRILRRLMEEKYPPVAPQTLSPEPTPPLLPPVNSRPLPLIKCPSPEAVQIIERFLYERRLRLVDLFQDLDKDKNWKLSANEFRHAIKQSGMPLKELQVDELMIAFDNDCTGYLNYRDLVHSLEIWRQEKKETMKLEIVAHAERNSLEDGDPFASRMSRIEERRNGDMSIYSRSSSGRKTALAGDTRCSSSKASKPSSSVATSTAASSTPDSSRYLRPPDVDLRPEQLINSSKEAMADMRRHNQHLLRLYAQENGKHKKRSRKGKDVENDVRTMIKTGDNVIDRHCALTTLKGEPAESIDRYRQLLLREYMELCKLCQKNEFPFTEKLVQRVLLHPEEKQTSTIVKEIRQPEDLLSKKFYKDNVYRKFTGTSSSNSRSTLVHSSVGATSYKGPPNVGEVYESNDNDYNLGITTTSGSSIFRGSPNASRNGTTSESAKSRAMSVAESKSFRKSKSLTTNVPRVVRLSTGRAKISSRIDCWMTFEEFVDITSQKKTRSRKDTSYHRTRSNAYWPGQILNKLCIVLDGNSNGNSIFHAVDNHKRTNSGYNNNLLTWPINDSGYVQYGTIEK